MERTLCIQVLGATGSGKTKLLALITTLLRKEGVLIVGTGQQPFAESVTVKFDAEAQDALSSRVITGYERMTVAFDDDSTLTLALQKRSVELNGEAYTVTGCNGEAHTFKVGFQGVTAIVVN